MQQVPPKIKAKITIVATGETHNTEYADAGVFVDTLILNLALAEVCFGRSIPFPRPKIDGDNMRLDICFDDFERELYMTVDAVRIMQ